MPLYDLVLMVKKGVEKRSVVELLSNVGQRVYATRGVITDVKSFGRVNLAYPIKKRDGRHNEAQMLQMTMMVTTSFGEELRNLNQDERLLRWLVVKSRGDDWIRGPSACGYAAFEGDADRVDVSQAIESYVPGTNKLSIFVSNLVQLQMLANCRDLMQQRTRRRQTLTTGGFQFLQTMHLWYLLE